jgi:rhamnosyltransferase
MGGTNPSLVEALSCRNLILAIDVPPNREVAEACAIYFKKDPEDLARKIHLLEHASDMSEMRNGAYELYARKYTVQHAVKLFVRLLERIGKNQAGGNLADRD